MPDIIDSYDRFIKKFNISKEDLYAFGMKETIFPSDELVDQYWAELKDRIYNNGKVVIRGYGRNGHATDLYINLYKHIFGNNNVKADATNNSEPRRILSNLTVHKNDESLLNYQVSHIFGRTKNVFLFESPWNLAYVPKIIDPFTGHETKGHWPLEFQQLFLANAHKKYKGYIEEYNSLISCPKIINGTAEYIDTIKRNSEFTGIGQFEKDVKRELSKILFSTDESQGDEVMNEGKTINARSYYFVFQNKTFEQERTGGYLWAPKSLPDGRNISHWRLMKEVKKGDVVFHCVKKKIVAISIAKANCFSQTIPQEIEGNMWDKDGWMVQSDYILITNPIIISDYMEEILKLQPATHAPFNRLGKGNTGYLFTSNYELSKYLLQKTIIQNPTLKSYENAILG